MGVPLINVLYQNGDPGTIGVLSTPLLLYHVEQLILGNIEVDILKRWVLHGQQQQQQQQQDVSSTKDMMPPHRDLEDQAFVHHHPPAPPPPVIIQPAYGKHQQPCSKGSSPPVSPAETVQANVGYLNQQHPLFDKHASSSTMEASSLVGEDDMDKEHKDLQSNLSATRIEKTAAEDDEDIFSIPFFTADTASISLDTSRFPQTLWLLLTIIIVFQNPSPCHNNHLENHNAGRGTDRRKALLAGWLDKFFVEECFKSCI